MQPGGGREPLYLYPDPLFSVAAYISEGLATGNVHVRALVANAPAGVPQRNHLLGSPIADTKPYEHLDNLPDHTPALERDFELNNYYDDPGNIWGHHMYNPNFVYPPLLGSASYALNGQTLPTYLNLLLTINTATLSDELDRCDPWPEYDLGYYVAGYSSIYANYLQDLDDCNNARTSQTPVMQFWDESLQDPNRPSGALGSEPPNGHFGWTGIVDNTTTFSKLQGMMAHFGPTDYRSNLDGIGYIDWKGTVNDGTITEPFSWTDNNETDQDGWQLIGNPYPSPLDLNQFWQDNSGCISSEVLMWDVGTGECGGCGSSFIIDLSEYGPTEVVPLQIGQGFWVKLLDLMSTGTCSLTTNNGQRIDEVSGTIYRKAVRPATANVVELEMKTKTIGTDKVKVVLGETFKEAYIDREDGAKRINPTNSIYAKAGKDRLAISKLPLSQRPMVVPLEMILQTRETVSITATALTLNSDQYEVTFHDYAKNINLPVDADFQYSFEGKPGTVVNRFALELVPARYSENVKGMPLLFSASHTNEELLIHLNEQLSGDASYTVTDMAGRTVKSAQTTFEGGKAVIHSFGADAGVYLVNLSCKDPCHHPKSAGFEVNNSTSFLPGPKPRPHRRGFCFSALGVFSMSRHRRIFFPCLRIFQPERRNLYPCLRML